MLRMNFFHKQLLLFLCIGIIPLLIVGVITSIFVTDILEDSLRTQAVNHIIKVSDGLDLLVSEFGEIIVYLLCEDEQIRKALVQAPETDYEYIDRRISVLAGKKNTAIYVLDRDGAVVSSTHKLPAAYDIRSNDKSKLFQEADKVKNRFIIYRHNYITDTGEDVAFSIARTIRDMTDDTPMGYVIIEVFRSHIDDINRGLSPLFHMNTLLLDFDLSVLTSGSDFQLEESVLNAQVTERINENSAGAFILNKNLKNPQRKATLMAFQKSAYTQLTAVTFVPIDFIVNNTRFIRNVLVMACLISFVVCLILAYFIAKNVSQPIHSLVEGMRQVEEGDLRVRVDLERWDEIGILGKSFNKMVDRIRLLLKSNWEKQERIRQAEIKSLQAQINPHFLYNTLDTIQWLAKLNMSEELEEIVIELGKLLRNTISCEDKIVTVKDSIRLVESYIKIQKIRYSNKLNVRINIDPQVMFYRIPKLLLQPIVENAVIHGLENKMGDGLLIINGELREDKLVFEVIDNGVGIDPAQIALIVAKKDSPVVSGSIGIQNVNRRIKLYYGDEYGLNIESRIGEGTKVTLTIPSILKVDEHYV